LTPLAFLVPGPLEQATGGYIYDRRVIEGLRRDGRRVAAVSLAGRFPDADATARASFAAALAQLPDGAAAAVDGLALAAGAECLAAASRRLRLVAFVHHPLAEETGLSAAAAARFAALEAWLLPLFRGVICPSVATARSLIGYGVGEARIAVVPPGTARPLAAPPVPRGGRAPLRLLCVAAVTPRKGHLLLIEALAGLREAAWTLLCIGSLGRDPQAAAELRRAIRRCGLEDRVTLAGEWPPDRVGTAYENADIFVLPSFHEGYGMAFAEALAHGLPIIGAAAGAVVDTVPETAGFLVPPGDRAALADALGRVLGDAALRRRLAEGAARAGALLPDWDAAIRRWGAAFDRLVA